ncbi:PucR family transcriptional regulator [Brevibacterium atlanticum]|uniref:PucR family transcriptional regulator n=1 Tax=Brevibacterium atlanticum TaxID=2697563 RepID=UPI001AA19A84|nr:helix-turn-helix domain-containing protein [Brevibacterium atlanticum]
MRAASEDPALFAATRRSSQADVLRWSLANLHHPGEPVPPIAEAEAAEIARDLVRSGMDERGLEAYRVGQNVAWELWMPICFDLPHEPSELRELLEVSWLSMTTFIDDTVTAVAAHMETERADLAQDAQVERRAMVTLLLEGAPVTSDRAEAALGYPVRHWNTAAVVWSDRSSPPGSLEAVIESLMRLAGASRRLTIATGASAMWIWLPVAEAPSASQLSDVLRDSENVRVAFGRPGMGVDGFRRSHLDAIATQRMLARLDSPQRAARYSDVQLAAMLASDPTGVEEFLRDNLGGLMDADSEIQRTVEVFVREQCNVTRTAEHMYTHRNTVIRRLNHADEMLPQPLAVNIVSVAAALDVLRWRHAK